ncbi:MAG: tRNA (adenosine(37)-N6)-threonylcarbamoyltransferase complex dimerization subunit type 1 TsaB [Anaerolineae bacterium]|nr:tRNA (adenosine(37)-N6)-threonylcarbamoyltransferase complex dimerization subunit type 1 TsaB [Anaerolineae bacterium]
MLLAIDTATRSLSLALHNGNTLIAEQTWRTGNQHNVLLAPSVQHMMAVCDVTTHALTAVAVSNGPGSYTGLRIGVAFAKGIAAVNKLPLIGVSTLDMLAAGQPFKNTRYKLLAILQAGRGRIIAAQYRVKKGRWDALTNPEITTWDDLLQNIEGSYYITGEVDDNGRNAIESAKLEAASLTLVDPANRARRAGFLAQEAWRRYHAGDEEDFSPAKLVPVYMNKPS